jgi:hypothetical protein
MYTDRKASSERIISGLCRPGKERSGAEVRPRAERQEEETASAKRNYDVKDPHTWKVPQLKSYLCEHNLSRSLPSSGIKGSCLLTGHRITWKQARACESRRELGQEEEAERGKGRT